MRAKVKASIKNAKIRASIEASPKTMKQLLKGTESEGRHVQRGNGMLRMGVPERDDMVTRTMKGVRQGTVSRAELSLLPKSKVRKMKIW